MTYPVDPNVNPQAPPVASPAGQVNQDAEIRQLARVLNPDTPAGLQGRKAVVSAIDSGDDTTPPTITVDMGGSGILVPGVRLAANYSPVVGDTVVLMSMGTQYVAVFKVQDTGSAIANSLAGGWIKASLATGWSHNGNGNGDVMYRRVLDNGSWKMEWQGAGARANSGVTLDPLNPAPPAPYRPSVKRSVTVARDTGGSASSLTIGMDAFTTGGLRLVSPLAGGSPDPDWVSFQCYYYL